MFVSVALAFLAAANAPAPATPVVPPAAKPVKEKKICTTEDTTGSIVPKRVCRTQTEWEAENRAISRRVIELPARGPNRN